MVKHFSLAEPPKQGQQSLPKQSQQSLQKQGQQSLSKQGQQQSSSQFIQRQQPQTQQSYTRNSSSNRRPMVNPQQNSGRFDMDSESPPRQSGPIAQPTGTQTLKSAFALQLQGSRGDEDGFSARDANIIATMMCEQTTLQQGQM
jgi:hypothetical protein